jgi:HEAT repeat protein
MQRLNEIGARAVDPLIQSLLNENESLTFRRRVADTLAMIGDPRAIAPLIKTLNDNDVEMRWSAIQALADIGDRSAIEPLNRLIAIEVGIFSITPTLQVNVKKDAEDAVNQIIARVGD